VRGALSGFTSLEPTTGQLLDYCEGSAAPAWTSMTFIPGKRRRLEQRTFWAHDTLYDFIDSGEFLRYDDVKVLLRGYKNRHTVEVEFCGEKVFLIVAGMVVFSYSPETVD